MTTRQKAAVEAGRERFRTELEAAKGLDFDGFQAKASKAFRLVANAENWKDSVDAVLFNMTAEELGFTLAAVEFFTGSAAWANRQGRGWHVRAAGYYAAVGA